MSFKNQVNKTCKLNSFDSNESGIKKEFELIKEYLNSQPEIINKLNDLSKNLSNIINNFIEYTKIYSSQIEILAMKIIPNYTIEGQLMQSIQAILLFLSEALNNLNKQLKENIAIKQGEIANEIIEQFKTQRKLYSQKIKNINLSHKSFKAEINLFQEYLVNKEYQEHKKKGNINIDDDSIYIEEKEENEKKEEKENNEDESNFNEENQVYGILNENDNKSELIKSNKHYIKNINESNDMLNRIRQFLSIEKTNILKSIYNLCHYFIGGLLNFAKNNLKNFESQDEVLNKLLKELVMEEKNTIILTDFSIKLKYLEIYYSKVAEKNNMNDNKKEENLNNMNTNIGKGKKIIKKDNKNNKKNNAIKKRKKNSYELGSDDNNFRENKLLERKTINFSHKQSDDNYIGRATFNPNKYNSIEDEEEKEELFRSMVKELNRDEIINIFDQIKETNIILNESDINLIEVEKNYKKIKEILIVLFNSPEKYKEEDKKILINFFEKDKKYILYFIKVLNIHRTRTNFTLSEITLKSLGEIFKYLNIFILNKNDMEVFKYILILSQTYYYISEKDNKKIYLFSYIKDYPGYSNSKFWDDYLKELINYELKKLGNANIDLDNIILDDTKKEEKEKLINCFFSNLLTTSKAMADFQLDKQFVREFIEKNKTKYFLSKEQIDNICLIYEMSINENESKIKISYSKNEENKNIKENEIKEINDNNKRNEKNNNIENGIKIESKDENLDRNQIIIKIDGINKDGIKEDLENNKTEIDKENNINNEKNEIHNKKEDEKETDLSAKENLIKDIKDTDNQILEESKQDKEKELNNIQNEFKEEKSLQIIKNKIIEKEEKDNINKENIGDDIKIQNKKNLDENKNIIEKNVNK